MQEVLKKYIGKLFIDNDVLGQPQWPLYMIIGMQPGEHRFYFIYHSLTNGSTHYAIADDRWLQGVTFL
jgi:hypothetical protein